MRLSSNLRRKVAVKAIGVAMLTPVCLAAFTFQVVPDVTTQEALRQTLDRGAYEAAEEQARAWCAQVERARGAESLEAARALDLLVEAQLKNGTVGDAGQPALAKRVVQLKEQHLDRSHLDTAISLHNLGDVHVQRGEFAAAVGAHERGLKIRRDSPGVKDSLLADSLDRLAFALVQLERFKEAAPILDESVRIRRTQSDESALTRTLELIGLLRRHLGPYAEGVVAIDEALAIRRRIAPEHPDNLTLLMVRGDLHFFMGNPRSAQESWAAARSLGERTLRTNHPAMSEVLRRLGLAAFSLGNLAEARELREGALRVGERSRAPCDPAVTALLNALAISRRLDGQYAEARRLYQRVFATIESCGGANQTTGSADALATNLFNQAALARETGDFAEADRLYARAQLVWSKSFGQHHSYVARALNARAEIALAQTQFTRARGLYERTLSIRRERFGNSHPLVASTQASLAATVAQLGDLQLAGQLADRALEIYERAGTGEQPDYLARAFAIRGEIDARQANYGAARGSFAQSLTIRERIYGTIHPLAAETRARVALANFVRADSECRKTLRGASVCQK